MEQPSGTSERSGVITKDKARELIRRAQAGDQAARDILVEGNLRLVASIVRRFAGRADPDDLFQAGCLGLLQAVDKFDLRYDVRFSTYAVPLIMAEIHRYLRENRAVRITRHGLTLARRAAEARDFLSKTLGRAPTPREIGEYIGVAKEEVVAALDAVATPASLDEPLEGDDGDTASARLDFVRATTHDPEETVVSSEALRAALLRLTPVERQVLLMRFVHERRQVDVAKFLDVSQAHVSRLERRILSKIREFLS